MMIVAMIDPKQLREARNLTQVELAVREDLSVSTVSRFEAGRLSSPSLRTRRKLAHAYGVSIDQIDAYLGISVPPKPAVA